MNLTQAERQNSTVLDATDAAEANVLFDIAFRAKQYDAAAELATLMGNHYLSWRVRQVIERTPFKQFTELSDVYLNLLKFDAKTDFEAFLLYNEHKRDRSDMFYTPRRRVFSSIADDLQDLHDGVLRYYALSAPQRTGKSTITQFFVAWELGLNPNEKTLMGAHGGMLCEKFYHALVAVMSDYKTYAWKELFSDYECVFGGDQDKTIDLISKDALVRKRDFTSLKAVTIETGFQGSLEVSEGGFLYTDDLISGKEEALNQKRLETKFDLYRDLRGRCKEGFREIMIGTRWNMADPIGRITELVGDDPAYRFRALPALNDNDESNFDFSPSPVGFSTAYYLAERAKQDPADWAAKFQQRPYNREGALFPPDELKYYSELPHDREWRVMYAADIAWGGGDYLSGVFAYISGEGDDREVFIEDVIFNKYAKEITIPQTVRAIERHNPYICYWEARNDGTASYPETVEIELRKLNVHTNINKMTGKSPSGSANKLARIVQWSGDVKKFYFRAQGARNKEYNAFMTNLHEVTVEGKAKHDDAADSLAHLAERLYRPRRVAEVRIGKRTF